MNSRGGRGAGGVLERICDSCVTLLPVTGASILVMTGDGLHGTVDSTDEVASTVEELHFVLGEGPCLDAFRSGGPVFVRDLADASARSTWPVFCAAAQNLGVRALMAFPLRIGGVNLGVLALHRAEPGSLGRDELARALRIADTAAFAVLHRTAGAELPETEDTHETYRAEVYQASGMISEQLGVPIDVALARLRAHAFRHDRSIDDVARDVVARTLRLDRDT